MNQNMDYRFSHERMPKLIVSLAAPAIAAQIINALYNIVDRMYIGQGYYGPVEVDQVVDLGDRERGILHPDGVYSKRIYTRNTSPAPNRGKLSDIKKITSVGKEETESASCTLIVPVR